MIWIKRCYLQKNAAKKGLKDKARLCFAIKVATFSSVIQTRLRHFQNQKTCKLL